MSVEFGSRLRSAMEEKRISARRLAEALEERGMKAVNRTTIGDYITGRYSPTVELLLDLAAYLGVSPAWLLAGQEPRYPATRTSFTDGAWPELPTSLHGNLREAALTLLVALDTLEEVSPRDSALRVGTFINDALSAVMRALGPQFPHTSLRDVVQMYVRSGNERAIAEAVTLMLFAFERLAREGVFLIGGSRETIAEVIENETDAPSVAPSVATRHTTTEKNRKRPQSKKG